MQRRELIKWIVAVTGSAFVGGDPLLAAANPAAHSKNVYTAKERALFDEIAETILPRTDTPGAKDAKVGDFIARYSSACYDEHQIAALHNGLHALDGAGFMHASAAKRQSMLETLDAEAKRTPEADPHWFTMCKQLTLWGFFSSEIGATKVARDRPIPGKYHRIPYHKGETFWA